MTADVTREPTGGQGLREAIRTTLLSCPTTGRTCTHTHEIGESADALIAGPLAAVIAEAERVRRVRELVTELEGRKRLYDGLDAAADLRRALDGEPQP